MDFVVFHETSPLLAALAFLLQWMKEAVPNVKAQGILDLQFWSYHLDSESTAIHPRNSALGDADRLLDTGKIDEEG